MDEVNDGLLSGVEKHKAGAQEILEGTHDVAQEPPDIAIAAFPLLSHCYHPLRRWQQVRGPGLPSVHLLQDRDDR